MKKVEIKSLKVKQILFATLMFHLMNGTVFALSVPHVQLSIGKESLITKHVPIRAELQMTCRFAFPVWYRHGQLWSHESTLKIAKLKQEDAGLYSCNSPSDDHNWSNLSLIVDEEDHRADTYSQVKKSELKFKESDRLINYISKSIGSSVQISCPAIGYPRPKISWTCNDITIKGDFGKFFYEEDSIYIGNATTNDSGAYKCELCNTVGCIEHITNLVILDHAPLFSDEFPKNKTVLENSSAYFECVLLEDMVNFMWIRFMSRNNESIREMEDSVLLNNTGDKYKKNFVQFSTNPNETNVLRLENVTHLDEGWYACVANNSFGQSMRSAYLKVIESPKKQVGAIPLRQPISIVVVAIIVVLLLLVGSILIIYMLRKLRRERRLQDHIEAVDEGVNIYKLLSLDDISDFPQMPVIEVEKQFTTFKKPTELDPTQALNELEFPHDSNWEVQRSQLTLGSTLGEGAFGRVVMTEAFGLPHSVASATTNSTIVAVKMVKEDHTDDDIASLMREMELRKMIGEHINVINLLGCCTRNGPLWIIVEFAPHGNLKNFLKKNRPLSMGNLYSSQRDSGYLELLPLQLKEKHLISFAFQIARGMEYLALRECIHRDLAARNILVSDDYVMKIADFGLARDVQDSDYYRKKTNGRLPIKWMAPESLEEMFYDSQSDVWSYGVLLWEIMTYGKQPYPNIMSVEELYSYLISDQRMEKPSRCSLTTYMLMHQCWQFNSSARPTFGEIVENLYKLVQLSSNDEYLDMSKPMIETPPVYSNVDFPPKLSNNKGYLDMTMSISEAPPNDEEYEDMSVQTLEKPPKLNNEDKYLDMSMHILETPPLSSNVSSVH